MKAQILHNSLLGVPPRRIIFLFLWRILLWSGSPSYQVAADKESRVSGSNNIYTGVPNNRVQDGQDSQAADSKIVHLTDSTFHNYNEGFLLVMFYAHWSGQSRRMFPIWATLAEELDHAGTTIPVGLLDSSEYKQTPASRYVHTLPAIFLFHKGEILAHFVKEKSVDDLRMAVKNVVGMSDAERSYLKISVFKQLEEAELERMHQAQDEEMVGALAALKFEKDIPTLYKDNFLSITAKKDAMVMIYTPWCEHCKVMKVDWVELAKDPLPGVLVAKINFDDFSTFPGADLLEEVPSVLFFRDSVVYGYYNTSKRLEDIRYWAKVLNSLTLKELQGVVKKMDEETARGERRAKEDMVYEHAIMEQEFENIPELTNENFGAKTGGRSAMILFYTEKGKRSRLMKPVWVALSKLQELKGLVIARFPEADYRFSPEMEYVHGYPTVLFARNGIITERYEGVQRLNELFHHGKTLLGLSNEEAKQKNARLVRTMQRERLMEAEKARLRYKAELKRREEEIRKERQQKRKQKTEHKD